MEYSFITLTFKNTVSYGQGITILTNRLMRYKNKFEDFCFYPEYGQKNNFHFHGVVKYLSYNDVYYNSFIGNWKRYIGFYYDSKSGNSSLVGWHIYCRKDQYKWRLKKYNQEVVRIHKYNYTKYIDRFKKKQSKENNMLRKILLKSYEYQGKNVPLRLFG